jgi:hypothetical protein
MSETPSERPGLDLDGQRAAAPGDPGATIPVEPGSSDPGDPAGGSGHPIPASPGYREVTLLAVVVGVLIGVVMNASITYAGLKIGFTIGGSAIAAVLGFGILKILRRGTIVETNIVQTVASAVNTSNSGVIFTVPVLILLGFTLTWSDANFWLLTLASIAGAIMGCVFIIPLRKQMIDIDRLRFPSAVGRLDDPQEPRRGHPEVHRPHRSASSSARRSTSPPRCPTSRARSRSMKRRWWTARLMRTRRWVC